MARSVAVTILIIGANGRAVAGVHGATTASRAGTVATGISIAVAHRAVGDIATIAISSVLTSTVGIVVGAVVVKSTKGVNLMPVTILEVIVTEQSIVSVASDATRESRTTTLIALAEGDALGKTGTANQATIKVHGARQTVDGKISFARISVGDEDETLVGKIAITGSLVRTARATLLHRAVIVERSTSGSAVHRILNAMLARAGGRLERSVTVRHVDFLDSVVDVKVVEELLDLSAVDTVLEIANVDPATLRDGVCASRENGLALRIDQRGRGVAGERGVVVAGLVLVHIVIGVRVHVVRGVVSVVHSRTRDNIRLVTVARSLVIVASFISLMNTSVALDGTIDLRRHVLAIIDQAIAVMIERIVDGSACHLQLYINLRCSQLLWRENVVLRTGCLREGGK